jgi:(5-formylfuran-3-yl)methyl phosphate synthase
VSVALGDGPFEPAAAVQAALAVARQGAAFVKFGLRETSGDHAVATLRAVRTALPDGVGVVVAGFADFQRAGAPDPRELPALARAAGIQGCLIDTAVKDGRGLLHWMHDADLRAFVGACREHGQLSALAGSLALADLARVAGLGPDIAGVRGAACAGDRIRGRVSEDRVRALARALAHQVTSVP